LIWRVKFSETALRQLKKLGKQPQRDILKYLKKCIETDEDPQRYGDPLRRSLSGLWKYRVGGYRLICEVQQEKIVVLVLAVGHRRKVYGGH
jgi:mRNA interferase RelE/StbE